MRKSEQIVFAFLIAFVFGCSANNDTAPSQEPLKQQNDKPQTEKPLTQQNEQANTSQTSLPENEKPEIDPLKVNIKNIPNYPVNHPAYQLASINKGKRISRNNIDVLTIDLALVNLKEKFRMEKRRIADILVKAHETLKESHPQYKLETLIFDIDEMVTKRKLPGKTLGSYVAAYIVTYRAYYPESYISKSLPEDGRILMEAFLKSR